MCLNSKKEIQSYEMNLIVYGIYFLQIEIICIKKVMKCHRLYNLTFLSWNLRYIYHFQRGGCSNERNFWTNSAQWEAFSVWPICHDQKRD